MVRGLSAFDLERQYCWEMNSVSAYYNEIDPYAAAWLRNLIAAGHIAPGEVDERDIRDVQPDDLLGFTQCHFFAGIGVWSHALRQAGWPDERPVWTGSCPCQPFSAAGKAGGFDDERHLWPAFYHLIEQQRPVVVFGEQVASKDGLTWLDLVQTDMEGAGYAFGAIDTCAAGVGAPHIRQRLYFVADSQRGATERHGYQVAGAARTHQVGEEERERVWSDIGDGKFISPLDYPAIARQPSTRGGEQGEPERGRSGPGVGCAIGGMANPNGNGYTTPKSGSGGAEAAVQGIDRAAVISAGEPGGTGSLAGLVVDADHEGLEGRRLSAERARELFVGQAGVAGFWRDADWIYCRDEKWRAVEPGTFPLAHGAPARVGRLRAYGNAIVAPLATEVIRAYMA